MKSRRILAYSLFLTSSPASSKPILYLSRSQLIAESQTISIKRPIYLKMHLRRFYTAWVRLHHLQQHVHSECFAREAIPPYNSDGYVADLRLEGTWDKYGADIWFGIWWNVELSRSSRGCWRCGGGESRIRLVDDGRRSDSEEEIFAPCWGIEYWYAYEAYPGRSNTRILE